MGYSVSVGERFGRLIVMDIRPKYLSGKVRVVCRCVCDCGAEKDVPIDKLKSGATKSCGCLRRESSRKRAEKHGHRKDRIYNSWRGMKDRCLNPKHKNYKQYGGLGITVVAEWLNFDKFAEWAYSHGYKDGLTIDRIDPHGNYEPSNCRWISASENIARANRDRKRKD